MISRIQNRRKCLPVSLARCYRWKYLLSVENLAVVRGYAISGMHRVYGTSKVSGKTNLKLNIEIKREMKR